MNPTLTFCLSHSRVFGRRLLILVLILISFEVSSQNQKIDSLRSLLHTKTGTDYYSVVCELGYQYLIIGDYAKAIEYSTQLINRANRTGDSLQFTRGMAIKASVLRRRGLIDSAMYFYNTAYSIAKRNSYQEEYKDVTNSLGLLYAYQGYHDKALKFLFESLTVRASRGNKYDISVAAQNIGFVYYRIQDIDKALSFYKKANLLKIEIGDDADREIILVNTSLCYTMKDDFAAAKKALEEAFSLAATNNSDSDHFLMSAHFATGFMFFHQGELTKAESEFLISYPYSQTLENTRFQLDNLVFLSDILIQNKELKSAENFLKKAEEIIKRDSKYKQELAGVYSQLSILYRLSKNYKKTAYYQAKLIELNDSIFNDEMTNNLMKAEVAFIEREHQAKLEAQNKILALNNEIIFRQRVVNIFIGVVTILVVVLAIVLARSNKQKQINNLLLDEKVKQRTRELENNHDALQRAWQEKDELIKKVSTDIKRSMATMKGLCFVGLKDIDHPKASEYLQRMNSTSDQLVDIVSTFSSGKSNIPIE